jgi:hypothetical protein
MAASYNDIKGWVTKYFANPDVTHVIIVCDTFDWEDYPIPVTSADEAREKIAEISSPTRAEKVMEVYSKELSIESQMAERRAYHI